MTVRSAGILLYRCGPGGGLEVLVAHMGGPYWAGKDEGAWSLPKGEYEAPQEPLAAALREFTEELGLPVPPGDLLPLGEQRQRSGKVLVVWALEGDLDVDAVQPGTFEMPWPPRSGRLATFPEVDRAQWVDLPTAARLLVVGQRPFLDVLAERLAARRRG